MDGSTRKVETSQGEYFKNDEDRRLAEMQQVRKNILNDSDQLKRKATVPGGILTGAVLLPDEEKREKEKKDAKIESVEWKSLFADYERRKHILENG